MIFLGSVITLCVALLFSVVVCVPNTQFGVRVGLIEAGL